MKRLREVRKYSYLECCFAFPRPSASSSFVLCPVHSLCHQEDCDDDLVCTGNGFKSQYATKD